MPENAQLQHPQYVCFNNDLKKYSSHGFLQSRLLDRSDLVKASHSRPQNGLQRVTDAGFKTQLSYFLTIHYTVYQLCYVTNGSDYPFHGLCCFGKPAYYSHRGTMQQSVC